MRTKELKVENKKTEAVLMAGGDGFKIYSVAKPEGWAIVTGRKVNFFEDNSKYSETIVNYVNIQYHSIEMKDEITAKLNELVSQFKNNQK